MRKYAKNTTIVCFSTILSILEYLLILYGLIALSCFCNIVGLIYKTTPNCFVNLIDVMNSYCLIIIPLSIIANAYLGQISITIGDLI